MLLSTLARVAVALQLLSVANSEKFILKPIPRDDVSANQVRLAYHGPTGMTVSWNTYSEVSQPTVNYGLSADSLTSQATSQVSITYPTSTTWNNHVSIDGLQSDTTYFYQIENDSNVYTFTTSKAAGSTGEYTFAVAIDLGTMGPLGLSDTSGDGDALAPGEINTITSLTNAANEFDFLWQPGDIAYADAWLKEEYQGYLGPVNTTSGYLVYEQILNAFYDEMAPISSVKPYMVGVGNHEADCDNGGYKKWTNSICVPGQTNFTGYKTHWKMPGDVSGGVGNFWYSFDHGLVHYVQFDTETDFPSAPESTAPNGNVGSYATEQLDWLANDLKNVDRTKTPWVIAAGHRPWYVNGGPDKSALAGQAAFESILNQYGVDIVIAGHQHNYERMHPVAIGGAIDPNGLNNPSAPWYILNGIAGHYDGIDTLSTPLESYIAFAQATAYGWSKFTVHNCTHITHEFVASKNQSVIDSATLYKARDGQAPCQISSSVVSSSTVSSTSSAISSGSSSLTSGSSAISSSSSAISSSSSAIASGSSDIASSSSAIASGSSAISSSSLAIASGSSAIASGSSAILSGSSAVTSGLSVAPSVVASTSSSSAFTGSSISSAPTTVTFTEDQTTVITVTSCSDNACNKSSVTATWGPTTVTENDVATVYTTWCPITASAIPSSNVTVTEEKTTVVTITSCSNNACSESEVSATWGPTTVTEGSQITVYATWCPVSATGSGTTPASASPSAPVVKSSTTTNKTVAPVVTSVAPASSASSAVSSKPSAITTGNSANKISIQGALIAGLALLAL